MSKITIKTLTPIHVGSGNEYQANFEFLYFQDEKKVAFVDAEKVLDIIGEENIAQWVACIDKNQSLLGLLQQRKKDLRADLVGKRVMSANQAPTKPSIREQIHGGNGKAMLPGSSLKGSLRTVVFSEKLLDNKALAKQSNNLKDFKRKFSDSYLNKQLLGNDPNSDIFRLLQVGDVMFEKTEIFQTDVINKYNRDWKIKGEITQFIEAIPKGQSATMELRFNETLHKMAGRLFNQNANTLKVNELFLLINAHSQRLLEDEIEYWTNTENSPDALGDYIENLDDLLTKVNSCAANECVLRLGWGTGFRNMTGDWHGAMTDDDYYDMVKQVRPKHPEDLVFPKTTRFVKGGMPLGFVKLTF
jgi:CRISPR-associated protein Csm5